MKAERENFAGAGIVNQNAGNFVEVVLMRFDVAFGADESFLFAAKQDEANCTVGLQVQLRERAGRFENGRAAGAIVGRAGAEVQGIEVRAKNDDFIRLFGTAISATVLYTSTALSPIVLVISNSTSTGHVAKGDKSCGSPRP